MNSFKSISSTFFCLLALLLLIVPEYSCFPPNGYFEKNKKTQCVFFDTKTMQIGKTCTDGKINVLYGPLISEKYDTIRIENGRPADRSDLFRSSEKMDFPYDLSTIIKDRTKENIIYLTTDKGNGYSYSLTIKPNDWTSDKLFFTFYYRK